MAASEDRNIPTKYIAMIVNWIGNCECLNISAFGGI